MINNLFLVKAGAEPKADLEKQVSVAAVALMKKRLSPVLETPRTMVKLLFNSYCHVFSFYEYCMYS